MLGYQIPKNSPLIKKLQGASEEQIVNTTIEDTLQAAARKVWAYSFENEVTLRQGAIGQALLAMAKRYEENGIMN